MIAHLSLTVSRLPHLTLTLKRDSVWLLAAKFFISAIAVISLLIDTFSSIPHFPSSYFLGVLLFSPLKSSSWSLHEEHNAYL